MTTTSETASCKRTDRVPEAERLRPQPADLAVVSVFLLAAFLLYRPLWNNLGSGYLVNSGQDQRMWEWFFAVTAHALSNGENPLFSALQNHPDGVNLMANTVMLGLGVPLAPLTLAFGPTVTWAMVLSGGLLATATAWYWVLSRHLVPSRAAAAVGAAFCAFAPPIISHANAHPNFVALFLLPFLVLCLVKLAHGHRPVRTGILLGLLLAWQIFLGEEPLLIGATGFLLFAAAYAVQRAERVLEMLRPLGIGLAVAAGVSTLLVAYPLWWQFFGPQSYHSLEHGLVGNDAAAFTAFATESLAGDPATARELSMNRTEENAFFGWPLVVLVLLVAAWLCRDAVARAITVALLGMAWLSTGVILVVDGEVTGVPGPWLGLFQLPLYESVLESRFALGCVPLIGILLAMATRRVLTAARRRRRLLVPVWVLALLAALLPIAPTGLRTEPRPPTPDFFAEGGWREYVDPGGSVVLAPLPDTGDARGLRWQVQAGLAFPLAEGYFVAPHGPDRKGNYGARRRPTSRLLERVDDTGAAAPVDLKDRLRAQQDLRFWRADVVVLAPRRHQDALLETVQALLAKPPRMTGGVWVWDVRELTR
ncbi:glycosyl transferase [Amycolatopsis aidingensis]|uniref:glycosyl transferase n=1 Tax=Amycolatopsis aidingensis TaxID=2842453 RepID=UPI001C0DE877|nr:glycosyl transferase [Amycolatopsis aidingensis]